MGMEGIKTEMRRTLMHHKNRKASGIDGVVSEMVKNGDEFAVQCIWKVCMEA